MRSGCFIALISAAIAIASFVEKTASADVPTEGSKEACFRSYEETQRERRARKLVRASELATACASAVCPPLIRAECESWRRELDALTPTYALALLGPPDPSAQITVDAAPVTAPYDTARSADPGVHHVRVESRGAVAYVTFTLAEGQKDARVVVDLAQARAPLRTTGAGEARAAQDGGDRKGPGAAFYVTGGLAVAGFVTFAIAGSLGRSRHVRLEETCGTRCAEADADEVSRLYLLADVSLVVALVAGGAATWSWFSR